jgi:hypothetical protein
MGNSIRGASLVQGIFDLKGSMVGRFVKEKPGKPLKPTQTIKDKNLIKINQDRMWLNFRK